MCLAILSHAVLAVVNITRLTVVYTEVFGGDFQCTNTPNGKMQPSHQDLSLQDLRKQEALQKKREQYNNYRRTAEVKR